MTESGKIWGVPIDECQVMFWSCCMLPRISSMFLLSVIRAAMARPVKDDTMPMVVRRDYDLGQSGTAICACRYLNCGSRFKGPSTNPRGVYNNVSTT